MSFECGASLVNASTNRLVPLTNASGDVSRSVSHRPISKKICDGGSARLARYFSVSTGSPRGSQWNEIMVVPLSDVRTSGTFFSAVSTGRVEMPS